MSEDVCFLSVSSEELQSGVPLVLLSTAFVSRSVFHSSLHTFSISPILASDSRVMLPIRMSTSQTAFPCNRSGQLVLAVHTWRMYQSSNRQKVHVACVKSHRIQSIELPGCHKEKRLKLATIPGCPSITVHPPCLSIAAPSVLHADVVSATNKLLPNAVGNTSRN